MKNLIKWSYPAFLLLLVTACSSDDHLLDDTPPTMEIHSPEADQSFQLGDEIHFEADFMDNMELGSYKIDIHNNFDGHHHGHRPFGTEDTHQPWTYQESFVIPDGKIQYHAVQHINIPENIIPGHYHFGIILTDAAGNETQVYREIEIGEGQEDDSIVIENLEVSNPIVGESMIVLAHFTVPNEVESISLNIHGHVSPAEGEEAWVLNHTYTEADYSGVEFDFQESFTIPENTPLGEHHLSLVVVDKHGHTNNASIHFEIVGGEN